jgi:TonB-linked SusC/RagA family outer membrane protein
MRRAGLLCLLGVLVGTPGNAFGQTPGRITGTVAEAATGSPLSGATVSITGTQIGTVTGTDGRFVLTGVPAGVHQVQTSLIGHGGQTQSVTVGAGETVTADFRLQQQAILLEGIVATGYGTQTRRDITGSVASVKIEDAKRIPTPNVVTALKGKVAGVDITHDGWNPGAGMRVRIRGARSLSASNEPLYVIDGIPLAGGIQDFNPAEIESIDILKDASATAIYGSRGANGVLLITTNQGRRGGTQFTYDASYGATSVLNRIDLLDGPGYAEYKREAYRAAGRYDCPTREPCAEGDFGPTGIFTDPVQRAALEAAHSTDWQDLMFRQGSQQTHQLGVSGGDDRTRFAVIGGYHEEIGAVRGQDYDRKSVRATLDHTASKLRLGASAFLSQSIQNVSSGGRLVNLTHGNNPLAFAFDDAGNPIFDFDQDPLTRNPLFDAINHIDERKRNRAFASIYGEYQLTDWLSFRSQFGPDLSFDRRGLFIGAETREKLGSPGSAEAEQWQDRLFSYTLSNFVTADRRLGQDHRVQATLLYEIQEEEFEQLGSGRARRLPYEHQSFYNVGSASDLGAPGSSLQESALQSYMTRLVYHFLGRYVLTVTGRYDGSSRLAEGNKYAFFPSAAAAWLIGDEPFMRNSRLFSDLKLRASWGRVGNAAVAPYQTQGGLQRTAYNFGDGLSFGYRPSVIENPNLKWERTTQVDVGVDFGLFNNRITAALDVYRANTDNLLMLRQLPTTSGFGSVLENVGETRNTGIEISLSTVNIETAAGFRWTMDMNYARNKNEIVSLYGGTEDDVGNRWFIGQPIHDCTNPTDLNTCRFVVHFDHEFAGIWQRGEEEEATTFGSQPGRIRIKDQNGDGVINDDDRVLLGDMYPDWTGGLTNRFQFRNLDLSIFATARMGYTIHNGIGSVGHGRYNMIDVPYWTEERPSNRYPQPNADNEIIPFIRTVWYESGSHIRVRNITLGYALPNALTQRFGARSARIYGQAHDPFLFTDYQGYDPENATTATIPSTKKFLLGLNVGF